MSKRKKNRQKQHNLNKFTPTVKPTLTDDQKLEIEKKLDELERDNVEPVDQLSSESETKLKEAEAKDDLVKYWDYVKEINKRLESLVNTANSEKEKVAKLKDELETSKRETEAIKIDLKKKIEEYNRKDKEITEREFALDNGEYTGVIRRLLDTIKETEKKVFTDTENLLKELATFHKTNLEEFSKSLISNSELEKQINEFKKEKKRFEIEKADFENNLREEFSNQLTEKTIELERLQRKFAAIEEENAKLKQIFEDLESAFDSTDPQEILMQHSLMKGEIENLKKELNERPEQYELDGKQAKIEELQSKVFELQEKINESELLELKRILSNMDSYQIEINAYKNQIESAKVREASLKKTIDDLSATIDQLKGESLKKADAFEFAKKCDADKEHLGRDYLSENAKQPKDLKELVSYIKNRMAFNDSNKPFYYDLNTIRIFLAGLHMSPITILQGISGTGKTSLPREFAKALIFDSNYVGLDSDNQNKAPYRICAVQSGWRDNMDLMGYYNSFEHKYKETDFFKALYVANLPKYANTLFLIILDEMNLSRPEHYFADFLSLLEQSPSERYISLTNTPKEVLPDLVIGGKLKIPENVRFIGTANHDETTLEFAPKTYDRSNLMEMPKNHPDKKDFKETDEKFNVTYDWLNKEFDKAEKGNKDAFKRFNDFINSDDMKFLLFEKGIGVGNRFEYQAEKFIGVFVESGNDKEKDIAIATDHLITSRLFRTLKNRYDLDKNNLTKFKEDYVRLFQNTFKNQKPSFTIDLLDTEISKK
jgi:chromosome segregation ATPase